MDSAASAGNSTFLPPAIKGASLNLGPTLGAAFLGNIFSAILYGIGSLQTFTYFRTAPRTDTKLLRTLLSLLWLLDTFHLVLITHGIYYYVILNFGNAVAIMSPPWSIMTQVYVTSTSDAIVRSIFSWRIWILSEHNRVLVVFVNVMSVLPFVTGFFFASKGFGRTYDWLYEHTGWALYASLAGGVASDLAIAISLCYFLITKRTGYKKTDNLITALMTYIINTSLLTSLCSVLCFILFTVWKTDFIYASVYFMLSKLYFNSLLASLNARVTAMKSSSPSFNEIHWPQDRSSSTNAPRLQDSLSAMDGTDSLVMSRPKAQQAHINDGTTSTASIPMAI